MGIRKNYFDFYTPEEWKDIIEDCEKSGLRRSAYCKKNKIPLTSFYAWKRKLNPSSAVSLKSITDKWKRVIEKWEKSGLSKGNYCRQKELSINSFSRWEKKFILLAPKKSAFEKWSEIVEDWQKSGLKKSVYCRKRKLVHSSFYMWERRISSSPHPQSPWNLVGGEQPQRENSLKDIFIPLTLGEVASKEPSFTNTKIEVVLAQGGRISLEAPVDGEKLREWLAPLLARKNEE